MSLSTFQQVVEFAVPRPYAFQWHQQEQAFERLQPPWENVVVEKQSGGIEGGKVHLKTWVGPIALRWVAEHDHFVQDEQFFDRALRGPFKVWEHTHRFRDAAGSGVQSSLEDHIQYRLRGGFPANLLMGGWVGRKLDRMFRYRHELTASDLEDHYQFHSMPRKTIAVTGATGLTGQPLVTFLRMGGHRVIPISRGKVGGPGHDPSTAMWDTETGEISFGQHRGPVDAFIHLAGYSIASKRWNERVKKKIRDSRVDATQKLCKFLSDRQLVRESFLCASASGFYGDRGDEVLTEKSDAGSGFLADVAAGWESACDPMRRDQIRTVSMRFGMILHRNDGALSKLLTPFNLGVGGRVGNGRQFWGWISHFDTIRAIHFALMNEKVSDAVNFVAPTTVNSSDFTSELGKTLRRPSFLPLPAFAAKAVLGEMAEHLLLASTRVIPEKLEEYGFKFRHNTLQEAFRFELGL